jgi:hypothetical protein
MRGPPAERGLWEQNSKLSELLAWTAMAAQDQVAGEAWIGFALVACEPRGERPLAETPIAVWLAKNTTSALSRR